MKKKDIRRFLKENPVYIRSGVIVTLSILAFAAVYTAEQGRSPEKNSEGREILKRGDHGEGSEELEMKVQIGDINDEIQVNVSEKIYTDEELNKVFSEVSEKLETLILGENESLDEVRSDLDLITAVASDLKKNLVELFITVCVPYLFVFLQLIQRRLSQINISFLYQIRHKTIKEC